MPDLPMPPGATEVRCSDCGEGLLTSPDKAAAGARVKHNADGTHTFVAPTPPRPTTDPKPRGRRHA